MVYFSYFNHIPLADWLLYFGFMAKAPVEVGSFKYTNMMDSNAIIKVSFAYPI